MNLFKFNHVIYNNFQFGNCIRYHRVKNGLTQSQLADLFFLDQKTISAWERGYRKPDVINFIRLLDILHLDSITQFLTLN